MTDDDDEFYRPDFDLGAFRYASARYVKLLIRARWKVEPGFLPAETLGAWELLNIEEDSCPGWRLLRDAAVALGYLNTHFLPRCCSGGVRLNEDSTPEGRLIGSLPFLAEIGQAGAPEHNGALLEAAQRLHDGKSVDWCSLVDWGSLETIRGDLNELPHPRRPGKTAAPQPAPPLILDRASFTIVLYGKPYVDIDPTAFTLFEAIHKAGGSPVGSQFLGTLPAMLGKNLPRELNKLPRPLRALIKGRGGMGRWLQLPQTCL